jgi:hypothetical protein
MFGDQLHDRVHEVLASAEVAGAVVRAMVDMSGTSEDR